MHNGRMSDYTVVSNDAWIARIGMQHGIVLDITALAHIDFIGVAAQYRSKPNAAIVGQPNISNNGSLRRNENTVPFFYGISKCRN